MWRPGEICQREGREERREAKKNVSEVGERGDEARKNVSEVGEEGEEAREPE